MRNVSENEVHKLQTKAAQHAEFFFTTGSDRFSRAQVVHSRGLGGIWWWDEGTGVYTPNPYVTLSLNPTRTPNGQKWARTAVSSLSH